MANSDDPITPMTEALSQLHEAYETYQTVGFTKAEAMELIKQTISEIARAAMVPCPHCGKMPNG